MARSDPQVNIRMSQDLKDKLEAASEETKRSLNGEILDRLEKSFDATDDGPTVEIGEKSLDEIEARMRKALKHK